MPPGTPEFPVCYHIETDFFLFFHDAGDLLIFDITKLFRCHLTCRFFLPGFLYRNGTKQTADMIGAERCFALFFCFLSCNFCC